jgi:hypothetical protein
VPAEPGEEGGVILLVSGATATLRGLPLDAPVGHLVTPHTGNDIAGIASTGRPWAADNGCFNGFDQAAFMAMLAQIDRVANVELLRAGLPVHTRPLWVVCPDVVSDAYATLELWRYWRHTLKAYGLSAAFVAQDGCEGGYIPWGRMACLFIGGSTEYKESDAVAWLIRRAKAHGKAVHVGRVNTERRVRLFDGLGIDSIDGTQFSRFPNTYIPRWAERLRPSLRGQLAPEKATPMDALWREAA